MKRTVSALLIVAGVAVAAWWHPWISKETANDAASVTTVDAAQPGYRVTVDPATGEFKDEPAPVDVKSLPESLQNALSTSSEGLEVKAAPGGGDMIDLKGRFQSTSVAKVNADGSVEAPCLTNEKDLEAFTDGIEDDSTTGEEE